MWTLAIWEPCLKRAVSHDKNLPTLKLRCGPLSGHLLSTETEEQKCPNTYGLMYISTMSYISLHAEVHGCTVFLLSTELWICRCSNTMLAALPSSSSASFWFSCLSQRSEYDQLIKPYQKIFSLTCSVQTLLSWTDSLHLSAFSLSSEMSQTSFVTRHLLLLKLNVKIDMCRDVGKEKTISKTNSVFYLPQSTDAGNVIWSVGLCAAADAGHLLRRSPTGQCVKVSSSDI